MTKTILDEKKVLDNIFEGYPVVLINERGEKITLSYCEHSSRPFGAVIEHFIEHEHRAFDNADDFMAYIQKPDGLNIVDVKY